MATLLGSRFEGRIQLNQFLLRKLPQINIISNIQVSGGARNLTKGGHNFLIFFQAYFFSAELI